jgi:mannan endo-1,4-beta-mannosidase
MRKVLLLLSLLVAVPVAAQTITITVPAHTVTVTIPAHTVTVTVDASVPLVVDAGQDASKPDASVDAGQPVVDAGPKDAGQPVVDAGTVPPSGVFKVVGSKLYDPNGVEFRMRGTNKTHQDSWSPSLGQMPSNATRWIIYFVDDPARAVRDMQSSNIGGTTVNGKDVQIPGFWDATCSGDIGKFNTAVNRWVRDMPTYKTFERFMILNIANEALNGVDQWRTGYLDAIAKIRAAGWTGTIMIDAPNCGQRADAIVQAGKTLLDADPLRNLLFSWHIYGMVYDSQGGIAKTWNEQIDLVPTMDALKASGLAVVIGEFGPGRNVGASPTNITPTRIVELAEARGFGWHGAGETGSESSFAHLKQGWTYNSDDDLTTFGREVKALWLKYGAKAASIFN